MDAAVSGDWPGWQRVPGLDPNCIVDVALDPVTALPAVTWVACANGKPGCIEMQTGWRTDGVADNFTLVLASNGDSQRYFRPVIRRTTTVFEADVYDLKTFEPLAGWRSDETSRSCNVFPTLAQTQLVNVARDVTSTSPTAFSELYASGSPASLTSTPKWIALPSTLLNSESIQDTAASDTTFAFDLVPSGIIARVDLSSGNTARTTFSDVLLNPKVRDDSVFAWDQHGGDGWAYETLIKPDGSTQSFRAVPNRHVSMFDTDGSSLVWVESYGGTPSTYNQPNIEVWSAPYTNDPAAAAATAKKVATLPASQPSQEVAFDGYFAVSDSVHTWVIRLSDGALQTIDGGNNRSFGGLAYVTPTDLWSTMSPTGSPSHPSFARISLSAWP